MDMNDTPQLVSPANPSHALTVGVTFFENANAKSGGFEEMSWLDFVECARDPADVICGSGDIETLKRKLPLFRLARFNGDTRATGSLPPPAIWGVEGDYDACEVSVVDAVRRLKAAGIEALIYTTPRHTAERPRWRIVVPLAKPAPGAHRAALLRRVDKALGRILARESYDANRCYFFGRIEGVHYEAIRVQGLPLDSAVSEAEIDEAAKYITGQRQSTEHATTHGRPSQIIKRAHPLPLLTVPGVPPEALDALSWADASDYGSWIGVGHSLKAAERAGAAWAESAWLAWSQQSPKWKDGDARRWDGFRPEHSTLDSLFIATGCPAPSRLDSVAADAREEQRQRAQAIGEGQDKAATEFPVMARDDMRERFVFVAEGSRVVGRGPRAVNLALSDFRNLTAASRDNIGTVRTPRWRYVADDWLADPQRLSTTTVTFAPGRGEFTQSPDGASALNLWHERSSTTPRDWRQRAEPFLRHVAYLVPVPEQRERFLDWLAHIEQRPGVLPHTHWLFFTEMTGIGRNWLASLLARVWAGNVALSFDLGKALDSDFNGRLSQKLLVTVDETREALGGRLRIERVKNEIKSLLTAEQRLINPKFGRQHVEFNCARWLLFSNHEDALPLDANERRIVVVQNPSTRQPAVYFVKLYAALDDAAFVDSVRAFLRTRDIATYNPSEPAPMSAAKARLIAANEDDLVSTVHSIVEGWPGDVIASSELRARAVRFGDKVSGPQFAAACKAAGLVVHGERVKVNSRHGETVWIVRNAERWLTASSGQIINAAREACEAGALFD